MTRRIAALAVTLFAAFSSSALGSGAVRELPNSILPGDPVTVSIALDVPPGTTVVAAEDQPPSGWIISNISNGGAYDQSTGKVKWGLFFAPSIPATLFYQATSAPGPACFAGLVSYDGLDAAITGDQCSVAVPAVSAWGVLCLGLVMAVAGTVFLQRKKTEEEGFEPP